MLDEILKKESWDDKDINILIENKDVLSDDVLIKLGIMEPAIETMFIESSPVKKKRKLQK